MEIKNLLKFLRLIETIPMEYMVTGSVASILYGKPRLTQDMDVVVVFPQIQISSFCRLFDLKEFYSPPEEAIREALAQGDKGHMNIIDQATGFKIDLYPFGNDPLVAWGLERRKLLEMLPGEKIWVAPPEYVILKKLVYYQEGGSDKHLEDIRAMLEVSSKEMDQKEIQKWIADLKLENAWKKI